jgi:hypothetical protein
VLAGGILVIFIYDFGKFNFLAPVKWIIFSSPNFVRVGGA